jgi:predicted ArsR family transcriptional regulator
MTLMELLKRAGETDVASLAKQLGISGVAVRQHLAALERDGKITQRSVRRPVGRPAKLYRLTRAADQAFPQASAKVALDLLARLENAKGPEALENLLQARLRDLLGRYQERLKGARSWAKKLEILAEIRESEGYLCDSESAPPSEATSWSSSGACWESPTSAASTTSAPAGTPASTNCREKPGDAVRFREI